MSDAGLVYIVLVVVVFGSLAWRRYVAESRASVADNSRDILSGYDIRAMPFWGKMPSMDAWYVKTLISGHDRAICPSREELHATLYERFNSTANALLDELYEEVK